MYLYQKKLLLLDKEFNDVRKQIKKLSGLFDNGDGSPDLDPKIIKIQLELAIGLVRLIKEHASYYIKLGKTFDALELAKKLLTHIERTDPGNAIKLLEEIDREWERISEVEITDCEIEPDNESQETEKSPS